MLEAHFYRNTLNLFQIIWSDPEVSEKRYFPYFACLASAIRSRRPFTMALSAYPGLHRDDRTSKVCCPNEESSGTYPELPAPFAIETKMDLPIGDSLLNLTAIML
jgi:hypothetical protein